MHVRYTLRNVRQRVGQQCSRAVSQRSTDAISSEQSFNYAAVIKCRQRRRRTSLLSNRFTFIEHGIDLIFVDVLSYDTPLCALLPSNFNLERNFNGETETFHVGCEMSAYRKLFCRAKRTFHNQLCHVWNYAPFFLEVCLVY